MGRALLEVGLTAIIARLDPFRVLVLREMQLQPEFDVAIRRSTSVQWQGDIMSKPPPKKDAKLWSPDLSINELTRALLGDYYEHVFWRPAFIRLLDRVSEGAGGNWMDNLRLMDSDGFTS